MEVNKFKQQNLHGAIIIQLLDYFASAVGMVVSNVKTIRATVHMQQANANQVGPLTGTSSKQSNRSGLERDEDN